MNGRTTIASAPPKAAAARIVVRMMLVHGSRLASIRQAVTAVMYLDCRRACAAGRRHAPHEAAGGAQLRRGEELVGIGGERDRDLR